MKKDIEKLLLDLHTARSFLDRVECRVHQLFPDLAPKATRMPSETLGAQDVANCPSEVTTACVTVQTEMFPALSESLDATSSNTKQPAQNFLHKKGCPTLSRAEVMANFRKISNGRELLDLVDVNEIFGYNRSTSGTFIKHAIKRGELGYIPFGRCIKFLAIDVKAFINQYFKQLKGA